MTTQPFPVTPDVETLIAQALDRQRADFMVAAAPLIKLMREARAERGPSYSSRSTATMRFGLLEDLERALERQAE